MIDPTKPIEAVHPDGRVVPMEYDCGDSSGFYTKLSREVAEILGDQWTMWNADGTPVSPSNPWTIRNVAEAEPSDPDDWAIEEALKQAGAAQTAATDVDITSIREMAFTGDTLGRCVINHASMIQRYQPELEPKPPVDPDVAAVREILAAWCVAEPNGDLDGNPDFLAAVEAFKRVKGGVS